MALSFSRSFDLIGYQLGVGELSVLAGVARDAVNWINSNSRDKSFLELLGLDSSIAIARKGLLDVSSLGKRWSKRVQIIRDGNVTTYYPEQDKNIKLPQLDYFTWFMTLVTAALSAGMLESCVAEVLENFLLCLCEDDTQEDYCHRACRKQIEGWKSSATVRGILEASRNKWTELETGHIHQPGLVPVADRNEVGMFLRWLAGHSDRSLVDGNAEKTENKASHDRFRTASSDVWAIAMVLDYLGIGIQTVTNTDPVDEGRAAVIFDPDMVVHRGTNLPTKRRGMRINLTSVEEAMSLWPGTQAENSNRRMIFDRGTKAASALSVVAGQCLTGPDFSRGTYQAMLAVLCKPPQGRVQEDLVRLCREYLLGSDSAAIDQLEGLVQTWNLPIARLKEVIDRLAPYNPKNFSVSEVPSKVLEDFQIFVLGYYYQATRPLLDTSKLNVQEAFGAWTWNDMEFCELVRRMQKGKMLTSADSESSLVSFYKKSDFLQVMGYLYAGGEMHQIQKITRLSCGITSKLTLLDSTTMGDTDTPEKICRFCLIDIDASCFPVNAVGVMYGATQPASTQQSLQPTVAEDMSTRQACHKEDFTSIVEPDWAVDSQLSVVAFRHNGRIVSRLSPESIFHAILNGFPISPPFYPDNADAIYRYSLYSRQGTGRPLQLGAPASRLGLSAFEGNVAPLLVFPHAPDPYPLVYVPTGGLVKARTCVAAACPYRDWYSIERNFSRDCDRPDGCGDTTLVLNHMSYQLLIL